MNTNLYEQAKQAAEELIETAQPLVRLQGIHGELKPQLSAFSWNRK